MTPATFQEAVNALQKRAATDEQFRNFAKSDAHGALSQVGVDLPSNAKIKFVEPEEGLTIPLVPKANDAGELSDEQLENASGGVAMTLVSLVYC